MAVEGSKVNNIAQTLLGATGNGRAKASIAEMTILQLRKPAKQKESIYRLTKFGLLCIIRP